MATRYRGLMELKLSREPVCAGDDAKSHDEVIDINEKQRLEQALTEISNGPYLAYITDGHVSWLALAGRDGRMLAVVAQQWDQPKWLVNSRWRLRKIGASIHFRYYGRVDPDELFDQCTIAQLHGLQPPIRTNQTLRQSTTKRSAPR